MRLIITEKPSLAEKVFKALGGDSVFKKLNAGSEKVGTKSMPVTYYESKDGSTVIVPSVGHILELSEPVVGDADVKKWRMSVLPLPFGRDLQYQIPDSFKERHKLIAKVLPKATEVVHAGDIDTEGQAIVDNILRYYNYKGKVLRLWAENETIEGFKKAFGDLKDNKDYERLGWQGVTRAVYDQSIGFNFTRAVTLKQQALGDNQTYHVGRVKAVILGLVVRRDIAHESHKESFYYTVDGQATVNNHPLDVKFAPLESHALMVDDKGRFIDKPEVMALCEKLNALQGLSVSLVESKNKSENAPLPFNANTVQQSANKILGFDPKQTMDLIQDLYLEGYVSYPRTDCEYISTADYNNTVGLINTLVSQRHAGVAMHIDTTKQGRMINDKVREEMAHSAIIPQKQLPPTKFSEAHQRLYWLIADRYIANFCNAYQCRLTKLSIDLPSLGSLATVSKTLIDLGYKHVLGHTPQDLSSPLDYATIAVGTPVTALALAVKDQKTQPPSPYSVSTLLEDIATAGKYSKSPEVKDFFKSLIKEGQGRQIGGVGTSATVQVIYDQLVETDYLQVKGKTVKSTPKARTLVSILDERLTYPDLTALLNLEQQTITNRTEAMAFIDSIYEKLIDPIIADLKMGYVRDVISVPCPKCQGEMEQFKGVGKKSGKPFANFTCQNKSCGFKVWSKKDNLDEPDFDNPIEKQ